ncbi:MAG: hypothetical protein HZA53_06320 [Planctomycetes bacterium]|nr:hypothetical protein [Planctomycetota bacterium]
MNDPVNEFEAALSLIREALQKKQPLNRYHARAALLPLGAQLAGPAPEHGHAAARRLMETVGPVAAEWKQAVEDELEMAVTEFAKSVDRRYLARPDYDFAYTLDVRERLAERLGAMDVLGLTFPPSWMRELERADRELAPHLAQKRGGG